MPSSIIPKPPTTTPACKIPHGSANDPDPMLALAKLKKVAISLQNREREGEEWLSWRYLFCIRSRGLTWRPFSCTSDSLPLSLPQRTLTAGGFLSCCLPVTVDVHLPHSLLVIRTKEKVVERRGNSNSCLKPSSLLHRYTSPPSIAGR